VFIHQIQSCVCYELIQMSVIFFLRYKMDILSHMETEEVILW
jgi:hypothetical protein